MKLAKKVLACVVALALIGTLAISAFAADPALVIDAPKTATVDDEITVKVTLNGATNWESGTFALTFDNTKLEYLSQKSTGDFSMNEGGLLDDGKTATVALVYSKASTVDTVEIVTFTFKVKAAGEAALSFGVIEDDINGIAMPADASAKIAISEYVAPETTTAAPVDTTKADDTTKPEDKIPATGDAGIAVAAGLVVLAGAAFVASKKTK